MTYIIGAEPINCWEDIIDSRDVIARIAFLEGESVERELDDDEVNELNDLNDLQSQGRDASSDWNYGSTMINDSFFTE